MTTAALTKHYLIGLVAGIGFGAFLALALAEDGSFAPGITPESVMWKAVKYGGLLVATMAGTWYAVTRKQWREHVHLGSGASQK